MIALAVFALTMSPPGNGRQPPNAAPLKGDVPNGKLYMEGAVELSGVIAGKYAPPFPSFIVTEAAVPASALISLPHSHTIWLAVGGEAVILPDETSDATDTGEVVKT